MDLICKVFCALHGVTVDFEDDVAGCEARFIGRAGGTNALDGRAVDLLRECRVVSGGPA